MVDFSSEIFLKNLYKFIYVLYKSYPEFISNYYYIIIVSLPSGNHFIELKNLILSCGPKEIEKPDPFSDEIDSILSKRTENENEATKRLKTEFLIQFDGLGSNNNAKLLVIAATNRPMDLDEALLRRLPKRVYCGPLDQNGRFDFIKKVINKVETNLSDKDIMEIAKMTKGYSNSDLKELCKEAAFQPVRELTMEQIMKIKKFRPLVKNDLVLAVNKIRGSLNNKIIGELLKWNEQFGGV
jgi:spastin